MIIAFLKENDEYESRSMLLPEHISSITKLGFKVLVENGYAKKLNIDDKFYKDSGAELKSASDICLLSDIIIKISGKGLETFDFKDGSLIVTAFFDKNNDEILKLKNSKKLEIFGLNYLPRITRAQAMDVLSSQSNLSGYQAVIKGADNFNSAFPMMMTAAGTVAPAKVFVMGVGVAGLQAIATAKRMGAIVTAYDVRAATKEQVESLGGKFLIVDEEAMKEAETSGGYAKEMTEEYKKKEQEVIKKHISDQDIVITTALIPGRPAPKLVTAEMVKLMRTGSVIVDLAAEMGGNCELTKRNEIFDADGIKIVGFDNLPGELPKDASTLFAKNLLNFLSPHVNAESKSLDLDWEDETVKNTLVTKDGNIVSEIVKGVS